MTVKGKGGAYYLLNFSTNRSAISVTATGGAYNTIQVIGSSNTVGILGEGGAVLNVVMIGNWNNATVASQGGTSTAHINVLLVGNHDNVSVSNNGVKPRNLVTAWGTYDLVDASKAGGSTQVYFNGFDPDNPVSALCPYDDLALTDNVTGTAPSNSVVTFNDTTLNNTANPLHNFPKPDWTTIYNTPVLFGCLFFPTFNSGGVHVVAGSFVIHLLNSYAPPAEVAFDQGAVIEAQPGGYPVMVDPPSLNFAGGNAVIWLPAFQQTIGTQSGTGVAVLSMRLVTVETFSFPGGGWEMNTSHRFGSGAIGSIQVNYTTPYAYAWMSYLSQALSSTGGSVSCSAVPPSNSTLACTGPFEPGGPLAKISVTLPAIRLTLKMAIFSISLQ